MQRLKHLRTSAAEAALLTGLAAFFLDAIEGLAFFAGTFGSSASLRFLTRKLRFLVLGRKEPE